MPITYADPRLTAIAVEAIEVLDAVADELVRVLTRVAREEVPTASRLAVRANLASHAAQYIVGPGRPVDERPTGRSRLGELPDLYEQMIDASNVLDDFEVLEMINDTGRILQGVRRLGLLG